MLKSGNQPRGGATLARSTMRGAFERHAALIEGKSMSVLRMSAAGIAAWHAWIDSYRTGSTRASRHAIAPSPQPMIAMT